MEVHWSDNTIPTGVKILHDIVNMLNLIIHHMIITENPNMVEHITRNMYIIHMLLICCV